MITTGINSSEIEDNSNCRYSYQQINSKKNESAGTENSLKKWGWNSFCEKEFEKYRCFGLTAGRIIKETGNLYRIASGTEILNAEISGTFRDRTDKLSAYPVIGDWVLVRQGEGNFCIIERILERKSRCSVKTAVEETEEQIIAANIDTIGLVFAINGGIDSAAECMEKYLVFARESGAKPVIILNKADLSSEEEQKAALLKAENCAQGSVIRLISAYTGEGLDELLKEFNAGTTAAFTGPSGAGKSTLINFLAGDTPLKTAEHSRGKQTRSERILYLLPSGLILIDSPGLREIQLQAAEDCVGKIFGDINKIAEDCSFTDCSHQEEAGCAVKEAFAEGDLDFSRYENYLHLMREINYLKIKQKEQAEEEKKEKLKNILKPLKKMKKGR